MNTFSEKIDFGDFEKVREFFVTQNAKFSLQQHAVFRAEINGTVAVLYKSGKLVIQGKDITDFVNSYKLNFNKNTKTFSSEHNKSTTISEPHIGVDESGKGDFFGPLVIAGALIDDTNIQKFIDAGIKDSKKLSDEKILKLAAIIKANATHSVVVIGNEKYNELYEKFNNLNKLLAWGHARAIENILEKQHCEIALSDKFGNESLIQNALLDKGKQIKLEQKVRGEEDIAVAAASILARAEYVNRMKTLSLRYEIELPKGASDKVLTTAKKFSEEYGKQKLKAVAKLHFKTFNQI